MDAISCRSALVVANGTAVIIDYDLMDAIQVTTRAT